jgi:hypothetical protein
MLGRPLLGLTNSFLPRWVILRQRPTFPAGLGGGTQVRELLASLLTRQSAANSGPRRIWVALAFPLLRVFRRGSGIRMVALEAMALNPDLSVMVDFLHLDLPTIHGAPTIHPPSSVLISWSRPDFRLAFSAPSGPDGTTRRTDRLVG